MAHEGRTTPVPIEVDERRPRRFRTKYDEAVSRERDLRQRCRAASDGPRGAPDELYDRWLKAAMDVWRLRARIKRRR